MAAQANTGSYANAKLMAKKVLGLDVATDEALNAKLMGLAQDILNQQTGTKTDFDFQVAVEQAASLGKSPQANVMLINGLIERQENAMRFGDLAREAYQTGGPKAILDLRFAPREDAAPPAQTEQPSQQGAQSGQSPQPTQRMRYNPATGELEPQ